MSGQARVAWFSDLRLKDVPLVGGKNASLGELYSTLAAEGIAVPDGFALTAAAYRDALGQAGAWERAAPTPLEFRPSRRSASGRASRSGSPDRLRGDRQYMATRGDRPILSRARRRSTAPASPSPCAARRRPRICRRRALPVSMRVISTSAARPKSVRSLPPLLCLDLHRPRHRLSHRQRLRPFQGGALGRGDEDGSRRSRGQRRHLHPRHRIRLPGGRAGDRRLGPGREYRAGQGRSG